MESVQTERHIREFVEDTEFNYPVAVDRDFTTIFQAYGPRGTPYVAIVDRSERVRHLGFYDPEVVERIARQPLSEEDGKHPWAGSRSAGARRVCAPSAVRRQTLSPVVAAAGGEMEGAGSAPVIGGTHR